MHKSKEQLFEELVKLRQRIAEYRNAETECKQLRVEKERLQAQLVQAEKMAGIGILTSSISHEFKNLLQIMVGHAEIAQRTKKAKDMEEALEIVLNSSEKAKKIIGDLLTFSRQRASRKERCDITKQIESILSLTGEQLRKHNIKIVKKYENVPLIKINKEEMKQVFLNMITNAWDAMSPKGGRLRVWVRQFKENIEIIISDTGKGIKKKNLAKVFEPFYTTKGAIGGNNKLKGTGLGLSVSHGIVKRHGGTIEVKSKAGKGTDFIIKLPEK